MNTNEREEKERTQAMDGQTFWHQTELGKALGKRLPHGVTRVIIDLPADGLMKIYYASVDTGPILDLKWDQVIEQFEVVSPVGSPPVCQTPNSPFYGVPIAVHYQWEPEPDIIRTLHDMPAKEYWATTNPEKITCSLCKQLFAERFGSATESTKDTEKGTIDG